MTTAAPPPSARAADPLERLLAFVAAAGGPLDRLRAEALAGRRPGAEAAGALGERQDATGAFAPLAPGLAEDPVEATLEGLRALFALRQLRTTAVERAAGFLAAAQADDGAWGDPGEDLEARIARTAFVGAALGRTVYVRPAVLTAAGGFLEAHWSRERVEAGRWEPLAGHAAFFANVPHDLSDEALQWCGRALERGFRSGGFDALQTARVFTLCDAVRLPGAGIAPGDVVQSLCAAQDADGGFGPAGAPPAQRVAASLEALLALVRLPGD